MRPNLLHAPGFSNDVKRAGWAWVKPCYVHALSCSCMCVCLCHRYMPLSSRQLSAAKEPTSRSPMRGPLTQTEPTELVTTTACLDMGFTWIRGGLVWACVCQSSAIGTTKSTSVMTQRWRWWAMQSIHQIAPTFTYIQCPWLYVFARTLEQTIWLQPWFFSIGLWPGLQKLWRKEHHAIPDQQKEPFAKCNADLCWVVIIRKNEKQLHLDTSGYTSTLNNIFQQMSSYCNKNRQKSKLGTLRALLGVRSDPADVLRLSAVLHIPLIHRFATRWLVSFFTTGPAPHKGASAMDFQALLEFGRNGPAVLICSNVL